jgi:drug/metabolite transporter (DMT)-like permease
MKLSSRGFAYLALLGNTVLWSLAIPFAKRGFQDGLTPAVFLFSRFLIAGLLSIPIMILLWRRRQVAKVFSFKFLRRLVPLEILGSFLALLLLYEGVQRTSVVEASLISITWPVFVTLGGVWFFGERENRYELTGLLLAIFGSLLIIVHPLLNHGLRSGSLTGNLLILGQNITIAAYYLLAKKTYNGASKWAVTSASFWVGTLAFGLLIFLRGSSPALELTFLFTNPSPWPLLAAVYMATFGSILALTVYLFGQDRIEASEAALFTYLQPVFTIPIALVFLGETISLWELGGGAIILIGVFWAATHPKG